MALVGNRVTFDLVVGRRSSAKESAFGKQEDGAQILGGIFVCSFYQSI